MSYVSEVLADAPVAWWRPSASTGATLVDQMGTYSGTVVGSPTLSTDVYPGGERSLLLDTTAKYISFGDVLPLVGDTTVSIEMWLKIPVGAWSGKAWSTLIAKGDGGGWRIAQNSTDQGSVQFRFGGSGTKTIDLQTGRWLHLTVTGSATTQRIYLNGVEVATDASTSPASANTADLRIGSNSEAGGRSIWGYVSDVVVYDTTLSAARVAAHYAAGMDGAGSGVLLSYRLDEASGTTAVDSSGNSHDGTYSGAFTLGVPSLRPDGSGTAVAFTNGRIQVPYGSWMDVDFISALTTFRPSSTSGNQWIAGHDDTGATNHLSWRLDTVGNKFRAIAIRQGVGSYLIVDGTTSFAPGNDYRVGLTYDGGALRLFVNGVIDAAPTVGAGVLLKSTVPINIARSGGGIFELGGTLDDLIVHGEALTSAEIANDYSSFIGRTFILNRVVRSSTARGLHVIPTMPWVGADPAPLEGARWWTGTFGGAADQFKLLGRATSSRTARALEVVRGATSLPLSRVTRTSTARPLTVDAQPPLDYYPEEILASEAAIYWRLESGTATDYSGNNRHGIMENWEAGDEQFYTPEVVPGGIIGNAIKFRESDFAYYDADDYASTVSYSIEIWIKTTQTTTSTRTIVSVGSQKGLGLRTTGGTAYVYGFFGQSTRFDMAQLSTINDGEWHQLVLTREVNTVRFYVDGVQVYTTTASTYTPSSSSTMFTGAWAYDETVIPTLDELSYYTGRALTTTEIARHYNSATQLGNPPLHQTITLGRATRVGMAQPLNAAYARTVTIGRASRSSSAKVLTPDQGMPPGSPQVITLGRATRTSTAQALSLHITFAQTVQIGRAIRVSTARALSFSSGVIYSDSFNRVSGQVGTPDVGGPYSFQFGVAGNYAVDSQALRVTVSGALNLIVPAAVDIDMSTTIRQVGSGSGSTAMIFRVQSSISYWAVRWTTGALTFLRKTSNIETVIGAPYTVPLGAGSVVRVVARGKVINVYLDDRLLWVAEDQFTPTANVGFAWVNDTFSRIEEVVAKQVLPITPPVGDLLDTELALMLAEQSNEGLLFKGRDSYRADEGLMA